ncbi:ABC transporter ATP-binding protein [Paenibacillus bovis]|uniref:Multidrug ABC transporter ATP-binding protein n=1 Tax=Paenibacillus bovis TaxID=1616788 RepID=A0A172ZKP9_9BACL|nr:ABC transporter ATP-binding protein [Paenibacillus bovis]ANF98119.1 multidrug ABC transporter ATP-binding protein [Paenibacillus bovis]
MLQVQQVSKYFDQRRSVDGIDFEMQRGEIVGFLGPNGAGKTTTMRMITGYLKPTSGQIWIDGLPMHEPSRKARTKIGYLPETPPLYPDMTVNSYLRFVADLRDVPVRQQKLRISEMIDRLGLQGRERQIIRSLSKGYKQRLGLAQAIIHQPDLLILDEPTSGLDPNQILEIRQLIRELGEQHTVLLSTHILPEVSTLCNRVLIINDGRIVMDGNAHQLDQSLNEKFQVLLEVKTRPDKLHRLLDNWQGVTAEYLSSSEEMQQIQSIQLRLQGADDTDFRERLSLLLADARIPILELRKERLSLEDVFVKLTTDNDPAGVTDPVQPVDAAHSAVVTQPDTIDDPTAAESVSAQSTTPADTDNKQKAEDKKSSTLHQKEDNTR